PRRPPPGAAGHDEGRARPRARDPRGDRVAHPGSRGQSRVPRLVRSRAVVRGARRPDRRGRRGGMGRHAAGRRATGRRGFGRRGIGAPGMTVRRLGFAYNPTIDDAVDLSERAAGWCRMRGIDQWAAPAGETERLVEELRTTDALVVLGGDGTF